MTVDSSSDDGQALGAEQGPGHRKQHLVFPGDVGAQELDDRERSRPDRALRLRRLERLRQPLLERAQLADLRGPEAERLALRARELAAGLDAWTGGWWSRQLPPAAPSPRETDSQEERP